MNKYIITPLLVLSGFMVQPVSAAPIYQTTIVDTGYISTADQGTDYASYTFSGSSTFRSATAQIVDNEILLNAQQTGYTSGLSPNAFMVFNDVIFSDTNNPAATGNINVSLNFITESLANLSFVSATNTLVEVTAGLKPVSVFAGVPDQPQSNLFAGEVADGLHSTASISVPLNEVMSLSFYSRITPFNDFTSINGEMNANTRLNGDSVFNLGAGITVNSLDAGIVNNRISAVPVPAAIWLFGSGIIGLIGVARRKSNI